MHCTIENAARESLTAAGKRAIELIRKLVHGHPDDFGSALQLSVALDELGQRYLALDKRDQVCPT